MGPEHPLLQQITSDDQKQAVSVSVACPCGWCGRFYMIELVDSLYPGLACLSPLV